MGDGTHERGERKKISVDSGQFFGKLKKAKRKKKKEKKSASQEKKALRAQTRKTRLRLLKPSGAPIRDDLLSPNERRRTRRTLRLVVV
jgi:hypothetical protein